MRKFYLIISMMLTFPFIGFSQVERNCASMDVLQQQLQENPGMQQRMNAIERFTQEYIARNPKHDSRMVITIPTVVHVVYRSSDQNISADQIQSQIDVLNEDFRRLNADASNTPSVFSGVAADVQIEFCLASVDPDGNSTDGITRTSTKKRSFGSNDDVKRSSRGGKDAWPASDYLNVWVANLGSSLLGYAQFPGGPAATDGVVCTYLGFGRGSQYNLYTSFNLGRTMTHEVGHWLNLRHIWGDGGCGVDDFVGDTPTAGGANYTGLPCTFPGPNSCSDGGDDLPDMFQNYMDYSDDACMNLFTSGQSSRMNALFGSGGSRASLLSSNGCGSGSTPELCNNGSDDDGDGLIDCDDPDCDGDPNCATGGTCEAPNSTNANVANSRRKVTISWSGGSGANDYTVEYRQVGASNWSSNTTSNTSVNINVSRDSDYEYRVTANCSGGESATTSTQAFNTNRSSGRFAGQEEVVAYPNPAQDHLMVDINLLDVSTVNIRVFDMMGRTVRKINNYRPENEGTLEIRTANLREGVYFLHINGDDGSARIQKVVIKR